MKTTKVSFKMYVDKIYVNVTLLNPCYALVHVYQGVKDVNFTENVQYVSNGWPQTNLIFTVGKITEHVGLNYEINACTNSNPWGTDNLAYCIGDQNNLHKHLHCHEDIHQRNSSFQHKHIFQHIFHQRNFFISFHPGCTHLIQPSL